MDITQEQMDELRLKAITAIDGLWFLALEKSLGFDKALEFDLEVWKEYGLVMLKRLRKLADTRSDPESPPDLSLVNFFLETICRIDGTESYGEVGENEIIFTIPHCSWLENIIRSGRETKIPCENISKAIWSYWLKAIDPDLKFEITHSRPRGDACCKWRIRK